MTNWKPVVGFEELYDVSDMGEVRNADGDVINPVLDKNGYRKIGLSKDRTRSMHSVHRLVAIAFIQNPDGKLCVDHINGVRLDNSVANLRWATKMENNRNRKISKLNSTGYKNVTFDKQAKKYRSYIKINKKQKHLGLFDTAEEAYAAYCAAATKFFGEFARMG